MHRRLGRLLDTNYNGLRSEISLSSQVTVPSAGASACCIPSAGRWPSRQSGTAEVEVSLPRLRVQHSSDEAVAAALAKGPEIGPAETS